MSRIKVKINPGNTFAIVYDWRHTAEEIRGQCRRVGAINTINGIDVFFVRWEGLGVPPGFTGVEGVCIVSDANLEYLVASIHEVLKEKAN